jgi:hypothetical protein
LHRPTINVTEPCQYPDHEAVFSLASKVSTQRQYHHVVTGRFAPGVVNINRLLDCLDIGDLQIVAFLSIR